MSGQTGGSAAEAMVAAAAVEGFRQSLVMVREVLRRRKRREVPDWVSRLARRFARDVHIFGTVRAMPKITIEGSYRLTESQRRRARRRHRIVASGPVHDDPHAILVNKSMLADLDQHRGAMDLVAQSLEFSGVCILREDGLKPAILSSSAVIVCREAREIVLQRRSEEVSTYPGHLHTLGGAYIASVGRGTDPDRGGLLSTVSREVHEESQMRLSLDSSVPMMMLEERQTGFIQLAFLGAEASSASLDRIDSNWEGQALRVSFADLPQALGRDDWVPTGQVAVLAWLALGAPGADGRSRFGGLTAHQLFSTLVP